jgi:hypothetical protein
MEDKIKKLKDVFLKVLSKKDEKISTLETELEKEKTKKKSSPEKVLLFEFPTSIEVSNLKEAPKEIEVKDLSNILSTTLSNALNTKPKWYEETTKEAQKIELVNDPNKPVWIDSVIAGTFGLLADLLVKISSSFFDTFSKYLNKLWNTGMSVRFDRPQQMIIIDPKTGRPLEKKDFSGGSSGGSNSTTIMGGKNPSQSIADTLDQYKVSDMDDASNPRYYGFVDKDGKWYILKEDTSAKSYRYTRGSGDYETATTGAWATRASLTYDYFHNVF